jgi:hypothetical protein
MRVPARVRRWLTGPSADPSVRARYWREVEGLPPGDSRVRDAQSAIGRTGWAATLLGQQWPDGHWGPPGTTGPNLYRPKFITTHWVAGVLADLGMTREDPRVRRAAELILDRYRGRGRKAPLDYRRERGGEICVSGMVARSLIRIGYLEDPSVQRTIDWIVATQKADGGWNHSTSAHGTLDAWEGLAALAEVPDDQRDERLRRSIQRGAEFFLRHRLMVEGRGRYPPWLRIHYPNHYYYDALLGLRLLTRLGYRDNRRLDPGLDWLRRKRSREGAWSLDASIPDLPPSLARQNYENEIVYPMMLEPVGAPSQWATVEALSVLAAHEPKDGSEQSRSNRAYGTSVMRGARR